MNYYIYIFTDNQMQLIATFGTLLEAESVVETLDNSDMVIINEDGVQEL